MVGKIILIIFLIVLAISALGAAIAFINEHPAVSVILFIVLVVSEISFGVAKIKDVIDDANSMVSSSRHRGYYAGYDVGIEEKRVEYEPSILAQRKEYDVKIKAQHKDYGKKIDTQKLVYETKISDQKTDYIKQIDDQTEDYKVKIIDSEKKGIKQGRTEVQTSVENKISEKAAAAQKKNKWDEVLFEVKNTDDSSKQ